MKWRAFMVFIEVVWTDEGPSGTMTPVYLGELDSPTKTTALDAARDIWPIPASCSVSKSFMAGHHVEDAVEMDRRLGRA